MDVGTDAVTGPMKEVPVETVAGNRLPRSIVYFPPEDSLPLRDAIHHEA